MLCYYLSLEVVFKGMAKKSYRETNRCRNSDDTEACASAKTHRREHVKFIGTNCKDRFRL